MSPRPRLESGELLVISVTPVPSGLAAPLSVFVLLEAVVLWFAPRWSLLHRVEAVALLVVGVLPALVIATRTWRWRSYKITLTNRRVVIDGGVLARHSTQVNLADVFATHADQTFSERLRRRGVVRLETSAGTVTLPAARHPAALRRLVDRTRRDHSSSATANWEDWLADPRDDPSGPEGYE